MKMTEKDEDANDEDENDYFDRDDDERQENDDDDFPRVVGRERSAQGNCCKKHICL